jgi:hypothetical protein
MPNIREINQAGLDLVKLGAKVMVKVPPSCARRSSRGGGHGEARVVDGHAYRQGLF